MAARCRTHRAARRPARHLRSHAGCSPRPSTSWPARLETRQTSGLAHFITFKGTQALPTTRAVSDAIEGVARRNAATDRMTRHGRGCRRAEARGGLDVRRARRCGPCCAARRPRAPSTIVDERSCYRDDPEQFIYNLWDEAFFRDSPWAVVTRTPFGLGTGTSGVFPVATTRPANLVAVAGDIALARTSWAWWPAGSVAASGRRRCRTELDLQRLQVVQRETSQAYVAPRGWSARDHAQ